MQFYEPTQPLMAGFARAFRFGLYPEHFPDKWEPVCVGNATNKKTDQSPNRPMRRLMRPVTPPV